MTSSRPSALVTGASSGIGADLARELARHGYNVVLTARRIEAMRVLADELKLLGAESTIIAADLSKPGAAASLAGEIESRGLLLDVLINNAGLGAGGPFHESDPARVAEMLYVNIVALTELTRALLPAMVARGRGRVMFVASTAAFQPGPSMAVYCASKAYVLSLGEALSTRLSPDGRHGHDTAVPHSGFTDVAKTGNSVLFDSPLASIMSSAEVARQGYRALAAGKRVHIAGFMNKVVAASGRFSPHAISLPITSAILKPGP